MMGDRRRPAAAQRNLFRHIGEGEALGRETHMRTACIVEAAHIGADAVVMRHALIGDEGQRPARGRVRDIGDVWPQASDGLRQDFVEDRTGPGLRRGAEHGRLLEDLAAAAEHGEAGRALRPAEQRLGLRRDRGAEAGIALRIVEIGQHHLLPDHDAELVAEREEGVVLIGHHAGQADHVHPGLARQPQPGLVGGAPAGQRRDVGIAPAGAAAEHRHAVDEKAEALAIGAAVDLEAPEANAAELDRLAIEQEREIVQRRLAMAVREPGRDAG